MELIRISDSKLKIMLSAEDMARYAISSHRLNYENTETRRVVWQILDEAKQKTGFDAASDRVLIQVYPSRTGGCEMYVTKVSEQAAGVEQGARIREGRQGLFFFKRLEGLLHACRQLAARKPPHADSAAYAVKDEGYYLLIGEDGYDSVTGMPLAYSPAEEYGERMKYTAARLAYIQEHAACLCENGAVERLSTLL